MDLGTLSEPNAEFLRQYKNAGFKNMADVVDKALGLLRKRMKKELNHKILIQSGKSYCSNYVWGKIDGENFHDLTKKRWKKLEVFRKK